MKVLLEFIRKEFYHIIRDKKTLYVLIGMPIAQLLIFGYAIRTEINNTKIGILDKSKDYVTEQIIEKLVSSGYFSINDYFYEEKSIRKSFEEGKIKQAVIFEQDFAENLYRFGKANIQILNDASDPNTATLINSYAKAIITDYQLSVNKTVNLPGYFVGIEPKMLFNPELKSVYMFVPGLIALLLMLISTMMTSISITREKELGAMESLLVSPLKPPLIIFGKVVPYISLALLNAATILVLSILIFHVPFKGSYILFFGEVLIFILTTLSLGILISNIVDTQQLALMISLVGSLLPTMMLSGFIYPVENIPSWLAFFSNFIPARWFLIIIKAIMLEGLGFEYIWKETLILICMFLFLFGISVLKFKTRLE